MSVTPAFVEVTRNMRLSDRVADQLLESITSLGLKPGDQLPTERVLVEQFAVSRTVIREAVRSLVGKGIIDTRAGRGLRVAEVSAAAVWQAMSLALGPVRDDHRKIDEVRRMLEVEIAGRAAERATEDQIAAMRASCDQMKATPDSHDVSLVDLEFHRTVARGTQNELHLVMLEAIANPLLQIRRILFRVPGRRQSAIVEHARILKAIAAHDIEGARKAMRQHLTKLEHDWETVEAGRDAPETRVIEERERT